MCFCVNLQCSVHNVTIVTISPQTPIPSNERALDKLQPARGPGQVLGYIDGADPRLTISPSQHPRPFPTASASRYLNTEHNNSPGPALKDNVNFLFLSISSVNFSNVSKNIFSFFIAEVKIFLYVVRWRTQRKCEIEIIIQI